MSIVTAEELEALAQPVEGEPEIPALMESEFETLAYMLRSGPTALSRPVVVDKLGRCNREQATEIVARLTRRSVSNETPWTPEQIRKLRNTAKEAMQ